VTEVCKEAVLEAQTILSTYGYAKEFAVERNVRDALLMPIIGGRLPSNATTSPSWLGLPRK
jgi:alkylation response protein AidB-like acyl-CoA dehydrogenase